MLADRKPGALLAADHDLVLLDEFPDVLEADGSLVQLNLVLFSQRIDQVCCRHGFCNAVSPPTRLHQIIEQQRDDVVGLYEGAVIVHDAEAVGVSVGRDCNSSSDLTHFLPKIIKQMVVRFGCMPAKKNVATIVYSGDLYVSLT